MPEIIPEKRLTIDKYYIVNRKLLKIENGMCWKRRAPNKAEDASNKFLKILEWDQYLLGNMKWKCGNRRSLNL